MLNGSHNSPRVILIEAAMIVAISGIIGFTNNARSPDGISLNYRMIRAAKIVANLQTAEKINVPIIHLTEARKILETHRVRLLDARTFQAFKAGHLPGALSLPVNDFEFFAKSALHGLQKDATIVTYCAGSSCHLSVRLAQKLKELGYTKVKAFLGGWEEWTNAKLPVEKGEVNKRSPRAVSQVNAKPMAPVPSQPQKQPPPAAETQDKRSTAANASRSRPAVSPSKPAVKRAAIPSPPSATPVKAPSSRGIGLRQAYELYRSGGCLFVDSRPAADYQKEHIRGAISLPLETFDESYPSVAASLASGLAIVVYCDGKECNSSAELSDKLRQLGFARVEAFEGGWKEWRQAGYPVKSGNG